MTMFTFCVYKHFSILMFSVLFLCNNTCLSVSDNGVERHVYRQNLEKRFAGELHGNIKWSNAKSWTQSESETEADGERKNAKYYSPLVVNTWNIPQATSAAWNALQQNKSNPLEAVVEGCRVCQDGSCLPSIGAGGSPDEHGETTLDAMVMDGNTMDVGSVGCLREIEDAIGVAQAVMKYTKHTLLVGDLATEFAVSLGFPKTSLQSRVSLKEWHKWLENKCQPNYWQNVSPSPELSCGPYKPNITTLNTYQKLLQQTGRSPRFNRNIDGAHHDTIGMVVVDADGNVASGTTTNGANHKIPGRVGDSPIAGAGSYAEKGKGGAAATGDGDVMMRLLPSSYVVQLMGLGHSPTVASQMAIARIANFYPKNYAAIIAANTKGEYGAACHMFSKFKYNAINSTTGHIQEISIKCTP